MASDPAAGEMLAAHKLAEFLTTVNPRGYTNKTPLQERMETEITRMATEIAQEVIANSPQIREVLRGKVTAVIQRVLRDDTWLNSTVTDAVARAISKLALERQQDED